MPALPDVLPTRVWGAPLLRVHSITFGPVYFGRQKVHRFDDPQGEYGVLYASEELVGAYLETVRLHARPGSPAPVGPTVSWLAARAWSTLLPIRPLQLVDLVDRQPRLKIPGEVMSGLEAGYSTSQAWSRFFYEHAQRVDGILYRARHDLSRCSLVLYDRDGPELYTVGNTTAFMKDPDGTLDLLEGCGHLPVPD